jgi:transcriptional regulator with GAF, ATPase, and Fis domain
MIAATNGDLGELIKAGEFRKDLYYRLNAFTISLPPLRERRSDVVPLAEHFREVYAGKNRRPTAGFSEEALIALQQYSYPGNVRELEHIVERALLQANGRVILDLSRAFAIRATVGSNKRTVDGSLNKTSATRFGSGVGEVSDFSSSEAKRRQQSRSCSSTRCSPAPAL